MIPRLVGLVTPTQKVCGYIIMVALFLMQAFFITRCSFVKPTHLSPCQKSLFFVTHGYLFLQLAFRRRHPLVPHLARCEPCLHLQLSPPLWSRDPVQAPILKKPMTLSWSPPIWPWMQLNTAKLHKKCHMPAAVKSAGADIPSVEPIPTSGPTIYPCKLARLNLFLCLLKKPLTNKFNRVLCDPGQDLETPFRLCRASVRLRAGLLWDLCPRNAWPRIWKDPWNKVQRVFVNRPAWVLNHPLERTNGKCQLHLQFRIFVSFPLRMLRLPWEEHPQRRPRRALGTVDVPVPVLVVVPRLLLASGRSHLTGNFIFLVTNIQN